MHAPNSHSTNSSGDNPGEEKDLLSEPGLGDKIKALSKVDNFKNFLYLIRAYLFIGLVLGATILFYQYLSLRGHSFLWAIPVTFLTFLGIAVGQHQLGALAHEALHHMLFKNRLLNELISDIFCMFPIFSITYFFRLQHLGHHHFVNDPDRDPDVDLLSRNGFWFDKPLSKKELIKNYTRIFFPWVCIRYMIDRLQLTSILKDNNPYWRSGEKTPLLLNASFYIYFGIAFLSNMILVFHGDPWLLGTVPVLLWLSVFIFYMASPEKWYNKNRLRPVIPLRITFALRATFFFILIYALGWISFGFQSLNPFLYTILLWVLPGFTAFGAITILQQAAQHANSDRGWMTSSRVFELNPLVNFSLFPASLGYHQTHHMFPSVPHHRLRKLHGDLLNYDEYRRGIGMAQGYALPRRKNQQEPTILGSLGPAHSRQTSHDIFIDPRVIENDGLE